MEARPRSIGPTQSSNSSTRLALLVLPFLIVAVVQLALMTRSWASAISRILSTSAGEAVWWTLQLTALGSVLIMLWRLVLVARYRPTPSVSDAELPSVTVIVPAYNEGRQVFETLRSLVESDYPRDRLQIVAVDDGSVDDTWSWMERGSRRFGALVTAVRCKVNRGKRHALYEGFSRARGDIIVTVDSDSEVTAETLRNLVSPFVVESRVGSVAGNVRVLNDNGPLGRMLDVTFTYAFEFMRASESMVDTVSCCPGALTAIRRSIVEEVKDEWLAQTFLGSPANIGEDRALTNLVLERGHLVRFQSNALVFTEVPQKLPQLSRMYLRWDRSNVREALYMGRFVFSKFRNGPVWGARVNFVWATWTLLLQALLFVPSVVLMMTHPGTIGWVLAGVTVSAVLPASVYAASRDASRALWAVPYALYSFACLSWIGFFALLTPHRSGWLTRVKTPVLKPVEAPVPATVEVGQSLAA